MLVTFLLGLPSIFHSYRMFLFLRSQIATIFCKRRQIEALAFLHVVSLINLIRISYHFIIRIYCLSTFHSTNPCMKLNCQVNMKNIFMKYCKKNLYSTLDIWVERIGIYTRSHWGHFYRISLNKLISIW